jgi:exonuclease VII large subunit
MRIRRQQAGSYNSPGSTRSPVGAGSLAMVVNDNASELDKHGAFEYIAGKPAPTTPREVRDHL